MYEPVDENYEDERVSTIPLFHRAFNEKINHTNELVVCLESPRAAINCPCQYPSPYVKKGNTMKGAKKKGYHNIVCQCCSYKPLKSSDRIPCSDPNRNF